MSQALISADSCSSPALVNPMGAPSASSSFFFQLAIDAAAAASGFEGATTATMLDSAFTSRFASGLSTSTVTFTFA